MTKLTKIMSASAMIAVSCLVSSCATKAKVTVPTAPELTAAEAALVEKVYKSYKSVTKEDFESIKRVAETGNHKAMRCLANMYASGIGTGKNQPKAHQWYEKMYQCGDSFGAYVLGTYYELGHGVTKNYAKAYEWYSKVKEGQPYYKSSMLRIAGLYRLGDSSLKKNQDESDEYTQIVREIADDGDISTQAMLGIMFFKGGGGPAINKKEGVYWLERASDSGNKWAIESLLKIYYHGDGDKAFADLDKCFELIKDNDVSMEDFAKLFHGNRRKDAIDWYNKMKQ